MSLFVSIDDSSSFIENGLENVPYLFLIIWKVTIIENICFSTIGTTSVAQSEEIVATLKDNGISAELLNASPNNAARESEIIAQAGRAGIVTVATNMAGRK